MFGGAGGGGGEEVGRGSGRKKSLSGQLSGVGWGWRRAASSRGSRLRTLGADASVFARECERVVRAGAGASGAAARADAPAGSRPPPGAGAGAGGRGGRRGQVGVACACGRECECARASGRRIRKSQQRSAHRHV